MNLPPCSDHSKDEKPDPWDSQTYTNTEQLCYVLEHAQAKGEAFVCAQLCRESGVLAIGVADSDICVQRALSFAHRVPTAWAALVLALTPGISGTTARIGGTDYNVGGLFFTKSIAAASSNFFVLYSGNALFKLLPGSENEGGALHANPLDDGRTQRIDMPEYQRTLVGTNISLEEGLASAGLMQAIRTAYRIDFKQREKAMYEKPRFV